MKKVSNKLNLVPRQISSVWNQYQTSIERDDDVSFEPGRKEHSGQKMLNVKEVKQGSESSSNFSGYGEIYGIYN